ncbi:N-Acetyl-D-glucosamine ABC transport system, permease protein 1 [hydrothermal vent metagenome]|uniref:N-Acetyl-D-glucosamine ABC transport system, permease protein 1 n=1 Tax=hydrothermal vent metagenome TaxID=652676 RepID=A0A3B0VLK4_9ZZZZ
MSNTAIPSQSKPKTQATRTGLTIFSGRRGAKRRETMLAYLFLSPAIIIIGLFGLFPLVFSVYQSTRAGLNNVVGRPDGLGQYVRAIDNLAYVLAFWMALFFVIVTVRQINELLTTSRSKNENPWGWLLPGILSAVGIALLLRLMFVFMPGLLEVGERLIGFTAVERNELFPVFVGEAWTAPGVSSTFYMGILALILAGVTYTFLQQYTKPTLRDSFYTSKLTTAVLMIILATAITWFTTSEIQLAYVEALEEGESLAIWAQMVTISAGFVLLLLSWLVWRTAASRDSNLQTGLRFLAGIFLMIGGWVLIAELPVVIAEGNEDWWVSLRTTVFYVMGALPAELFLGLVLATLLYQDIKAKGMFRMIYFLPYITPAVGAAAVFKVLFSGNPNGTINTVLASLGFQPLGWLNEPSGINQLIGEALNFNIAEWAAGPSLALVVAIIFGIWKYTGYNVVFFLAGLGNISREYYEAASIDGAGRWAQFRYITLPLLSPITYFLTIFGVIGTFKAFNTIFVLRSRAALGTMDTSSLVIFDAFNRDTRIGYAAALGIILLIVILSATVLLDRVAKGRVFYG